MSSSFDPYYKWLGIPPAEQPPHHYRLLGISLFEADPDVIEAAADQRMIHLRSFQAGQHSALSQKLLNETAAAKLCLLRADRKAKYDEILRQQLAAQGVSAEAASVAAAEAATATAAAPQPAHWESDPLDFSSSTSPTYAKRTASSSSKSKLPLVLIVAAPILGLVVVMVLINIYNATDTADSDKPPATTTTTTDTHPVKIAPEARPLLVVEWPQNERAGGFVILDGLPHDVSSQTGALEYKLTPGEHKLQLRRHGSLPIDVTVPPKKEGERFAFRPQWQPVAAPPPATHVATNDHHPTVPVTPDDPLDKPPPLKAQTDDKPGPGDTPPAVTPDPNPKPVAPTRTPVPDAAAQQKALAQLKDVLKTEYAQAKSAEAQIALANHLARLAEQDTEKNPVMGYVEASQALELAVRHCDTKLASELVGGFSKYFEVDDWELKATTLNQLAHAAKTGEARAGLAKFSLDLVDKAIADDRYDVAVELAVTGTFLAAQLKEIALRDVAKEATERAQRVQKRAQEAKIAADLLVAQPNDPDANLAVGKFKCFLKNDWKLGLPLLLKGNDDELKALAQQEQTNPEKAVEQVKLADAWWDLADKKAADKSDAGKRDEWMVKPLRVRAVFWYKQAVPSLAGLGLAKAQKRIEEAEPATSEAVTLDTVFLDDMREQEASVGNGRIGKHGETGYFNPDHVKVRGTAPQHALSMHPPSNGAATASYNLDGKYRSFSGIAAIMDDSRDMQSTATFKVFGDGKLLWSSAPLRRSGEFQEFSVRLAGVQTLKLEILCSGQNSSAHSVWVTPMLTK